MQQFALSGAAPNPMLMNMLMSGGAAGSAAAGDMAAAAAAMGMSPMLGGGERKNPQGTVGLADHG